MWPPLQTAFKKLRDIFLSPFADSLETYRLVSFRSREEAIAGSSRGRIVALVGLSNPKWAIFNCPCGCGEKLFLNLMSSHSPRWRLSVSANNEFSIMPSVDARKCGSHFFITKSRVIWCE